MDACSHVNLAQCWGGAHQTSIPSRTMSVARSQSRGSHATSTLASNWSEGSSEQGPAEETFARGSSESPCRAVCLVNFPRDGRHEPCAPLDHMHSQLRAAVLLAAG